MSDFIRKYVEMLQKASAVGGVIEIEIAGVMVSRHIKAGTPFAEVDALLCGAADQLDAALEFKQTGRFTT